MSIRIMSMVWSKAPVQGGELLLLQALADNADDRGTAYPGIPYLATKARMSQRNTQRCLRGLERSGLIKIIPNAGPSGTNKYKIDVEKLDAFPDLFAQCDALKRGDKLAPPTSCHPVTNQAEGVTNPTPGGDVGVTLTVIEPSKEPLCAHARPRESDLANIPEENSSGESAFNGNAFANRSTARTISETVDGDDNSREANKSDHRAFRFLVKNWPGFEGLSLAKAEREWFALSDEDQAAAAAKRDAWISILRKNGKDHTPAPSTYLHERLWEGVSDEVEASPLKMAAPFGKAWMVGVLVELSKPHAPLPHAPAYLAKQIEQGTAIGLSERRNRLALFGWPKVNFMFQQALEGKGCTVAAELSAALPEMEALTVDSVTFHDWQVHFADKGWPWLKVPSAVKYVWFPKGGPSEAAAIISPRPKRVGATSRFD
ncbi:hypothetical protein D4A92_07675 [Rhizobium rosettiformans]|uniref:Helix-turn-helix domain-containing protein n=1 Tax=Rhizobium rosettiformans TaxID=1368430 RepID=A0ABX7EVY0_9HYPH|nr:hypothetical protein [Rhizobium rosettiformans]QRF51321.1 hypothetical protein D4A92_07675 [Rhizobium rosettiformans]